MDNVVMNVQADTDRGYRVEFRHAVDPFIDAIVYQFVGWDDRWNSAGVSWAGYGTKSPEYATRFVEVLQAAIQHANERNEITGAK
jgi:hypothetical protein